MKKAVYLVALMLLSKGAFALTSSTTQNSEQPSLSSYTVETNTVTGTNDDGNQFISLNSKISNFKTPNHKDVYTKFSAAWSYGRGVGLIPNHCPEGLENRFFGCYKSCPKGSTADGVICKKQEGEKTTTTLREYTAKICSADMEMDAGLCYKPCMKKFNGVGPMCHGDLADVDVKQLDSQVAKQHQAALTNALQPGIMLQKNKTPRLKSDIVFSKTFCSLSEPINLSSNVIEKLVNKGIKKASDKIGTSSIKQDNGSVWVSPALSDFVLFGFNAKAKCSEENNISKSKLDVDTSLTVKVSTKMFDPVLNNLGGGVDVGAAKLSIYELIPFRVYGTVGSTVGTKLSLDGEMDKTQTPVVVNNQKVADKIALNINPFLNLWLSSDAYLRISSFTNLIPDLFQVGAKFKLNVVEWSMPYSLEERLKRDNAGNKLQMKESLVSKLQSGNGSLTPFMNILGVAVKAFSKEQTKTWEGYKQEKTLLIREGEYDL